MRQISGLFREVKQHESANQSIKINIFNINIASETDGETFRSFQSRPFQASSAQTWQGGAQSSHTSHQIIFVHLKLNRKRYQDILFASYEHLRFPTKSKGLNKRGPRGPSKVGSLWRSNWRQCSCRVTRVTHVTPDGTWHNLLVLSRLAIEHKPDMIDPKQNLMAELDSKMRPVCTLAVTLLGKPMQNTYMRCLLWGL